MKKQKTFTEIKYIGKSKERWESLFKKLMKQRFVKGRYVMTKIHMCDDKIHAEIKWEKC